MKNIDIRFENSMVQKMVGRKFVQYRCDPFDFTNSVTQIVGINIDNSSFALTNIQETVDYFGNNEEIALLKLSKVESEHITSAFSATDMISTIIDGTIDSIDLINENQTLSTPQDEYNVRFTRGIIFHVDGREISFEKDSVPFSEEIIIRRGYDLLKEFSDPDQFCEGWDETSHPRCVRTVLNFN